MQCIRSRVLSWIVLAAVAHTLAFAGSPQGKESAPGAACPSEEWIANCIVIERGEVEINGVQWRRKGRKEAYKIAGTPSGPAPQLFTKIQEALNFTGLDQCTREDLVFRSFDTVRLCGMSFTENFLIPAYHVVTGAPLKSISLIGSGRTSTVISARDAVRAVVMIQARGDEANPNIIRDLSLSAGRLALYATTPVRVSRVDAASGAGVGAAFVFYAYSEISDSKVSGFAKAIHAGNVLKAINCVFDKINGDGIEVAKGTLIASGLNFELIPEGRAIVLSNTRNCRVAEVKASKGTLLDLNSVNDGTFSKLQGGEIRIKDSERITLRDCAVGRSKSSGIQISGSKEVNISSCLITDNQETGISVTNSSGVVLTDNTIARNKRAMEWDPVSEVKTSGNKIFDNAQPGKEPGGSSPSGKPSTGLKSAGTPERERERAWRYR